MKGVKEYASQGQKPETEGGVLYTHTTPSPRPAAGGTCAFAPSGPSRCPSLPFLCRVPPTAGTVVSGSTQEPPESFWFLFLGASHFFNDPTAVSVAGEGITNKVFLFQSRADWAGSIRLPLARCRQFLPATRYELQGVMARGRRGRADIRPPSAARALAWLLGPPASTSV